MPLRTRRSTSCSTTGCCCCSTAGRTPRASRRPKARCSTCARARATSATCSARATCATCCGHAGIGHCRYPTAGSAFSDLESQPFYVNSPFGVTLGHNGNLTNSEALKRELFQLDFRHVNTNSDSEVLLNVLALELERAAQHHRLDPNAIFKAVAGVHRRCRGAYAVVAMIAGYGMLAFRDPYGIRPLMHRQERGDGRRRVPRRVGIGGARAARFLDAARRRAGRGDLRRQFRRVSRAAMRRQPDALSVHLRVRLSRTARFGARRRVGVRDAAADGRGARDARSAHIPEAHDIDVVIPIPDSSRPVRARAREHDGPYVPRRAS